MLTLSGRVIHKSEVSFDSNEPRLYSLSTNATLPSPLRSMKAFLARDSSTAPLGFTHYFLLPGASLEGIPIERTTRLGPEFDYFGDGDVVSLSPDGRIRSIFRANSSHNSILLTEQCNHYCLMCSQPPKRVDDSWLLTEALEAIKILPRETKEIGFTGGEPTIYGDGFIKLLQHVKNWLPQTSVHVLSNGRAFADEKFTRAYAQVEHPDLMIGIPIYSADASLHDYVVQSKEGLKNSISNIQKSTS